MAFILPASYPGLSPHFGDFTHFSLLPASVLGFDAGRPTLELPQIFLEPTTMSSFDVQNLFGVNGKVVLVTGGSRGIGKMVCAGSILVRSPPPPRFPDVYVNDSPLSKDCYWVREEWCQGAGFRC